MVHKNKQSSLIKCVKSCTLQRDKQGKFISCGKSPKTLAEKNVTCMNFIRNGWTQFYKLCFSVIEFFKKLFLRAGGSWVYAFLRIIFDFFLLLWRLILFFFSTIQFILGLNDYGDKFWSRIPLFFRIIHDLLVGILIIYGFYWIGIKISFLKIMWVNFYGKILNPSWMQAWFKDLGRVDNKTSIARVYKSIVALLDAVFVGLMYGFYYMIRIVYSFFYQGFEHETKPSLMAILYSWELDWLKLKRKKSNGKTSDNETKDAKNAKRKYASLGKSFKKRVFSFLSCGRCYARKGKEKRVESDTEFMSSLERFLKSPAPEISNETFNQNLVVYIGKKIAKTLGKFLSLASFKGDFGIELLNTWRSLNPSQKLQYMTEFLLPYLRNSSRLSYEAIKDNFYGGDRSIDIHSIVAATYKFITGKTLEDFLKITPQKTIKGLEEEVFM